MILPPSFYQRTDVTVIARELLGKVLVTDLGEGRTSGKIVEVEAYAGISDKASHAFGGRRTSRTEIMYEEGGLAYVYLCYGIHHLFNVVTNVAGVPHAILVRAVEPQEGVELMLHRRRKEKCTAALTAGPGSLSEALGIRVSHTGQSLGGPGLWIEDRGVHISDKEIVAATRVGVAYAAEDALLPYRYYLQGNPFVSKAKGL